MTSKQGVLSVVMWGGGGGLINGLCKKGWIKESDCCQNWGIKELFVTKKEGVQGIDCGSNDGSNEWTGAQKS